MAERSVLIRIAVKDGEQAIAALKRIGTEGEASAARIGTALQGANPRLVAFDQAVRNSRTGLQSFGQAALVMGGPIGRLSGEAGALAGIIGRVGIGAAASVAGITVLSAAFVATTRAAEEAAQAQIKLEAGLRATGHRAGVTAGQVQDFARGLSQRTTAGARDAEAAVVALTRATGLTGAELFRATELAADLGVALGQDTAAGAQALGRALADPAKGFEELRRSIPALDPLLGRTIAQLAETGRTAEAQRLILDDLARTVGGEAGRGADSLTGATKRLSEEWNSFLAALGNTGPVKAGTNALTELLRQLRPGPRDTDRLERELAELRRLSTFSGVGARANAPRIAEIEAELARRANLGAGLAEEQRTQAELQAVRERQAAILAIEADTERQRLALRENAIERIREAEAKDIARLEGLRTRGDEPELDRVIEARRALTLQQIEQATEAERKAAEARAQAAEDAASRQLIANEQVVAGLQFELDQLQRNEREQFIANETRKLSAEATELQIQAVREHAGALYDEREATKAAADAEAQRKRDAASAQSEIERLDPRIRLQKQRDAIPGLVNAGLDPDIAAAEIRRIDEEMRRLELSTTSTGRAWLAMEDATISALQGLATGAMSLKDALNQLSQVALNFFMSEGFEALRGMLSGGDTGPPGSFDYGSWGGGFGGSAGASRFVQTGPSSYMDTSSSFFSDIGSFLTSFFHDGGFVGAGGGTYRRVPALAFADAPRYHAGGMAGLAADERPAILQTGERVLNRRQAAEWGRREERNVTVNYAPVYPNVRERGGFKEAESQTLRELQRMLARTRR